MKIVIYSVFLLMPIFLYPNNVPPGAFSITRVHYDGGGDWYADPSSLPNLLAHLSNHTNIAINPLEKRARIGDDIFFGSSYLYLTGHGNIKFSDEEAQILRDHLLTGAFLHADDNYGMDKSFRREMKNVFPEKDWVELPLDHPIFNIYYKFPNGSPKIHEHDNNRPQALGLFNEGVLIVIYTFESDLGDGWENPKVHNTPEEIHQKALEMGTNIILFALSR
ncbi:uncharacterized protein METZ01_LOCUS353747 [marine metagenome]|uniref:DUF4159 domain-containing protein n=1 Tax=marine metagenome TaxID=408172 RepID=A0A382RT81_9ZZZZ